MITECPTCGKVIHSEIGDYQYKESGLDNVYVENIPVYKCTCGVSYASIFRLPRLNDLIGLTLVEKPALLHGNEIRFLRKNLYLSSKAFANKLGVGKTTLSKWENEIQHHSEAFDRLIRAIYMITKGIKPAEQKNIFKLLENMRLESSDKDYVIIAEKVEDDYIVSYKPSLGSRAEQLINIISPDEMVGLTTATRTILMAYERTTRSDLEFSSSEVLSTETHPSLFMKEFEQDAA
jgi:putative zinc finger/helix-turn-helix YgiT family protein